MDHLVAYRTPVEGDFPFIMNSWLRSYSRSENVKHIPQEVYYYSHGILVKQILSQSKTIIAASIEDKDQIFGYITYQPDFVDQDFCVHYVYIKQPYRRFGIARKLTQIMKSWEHPNVPSDSIVWYTHYTSFTPLLVRAGYLDEYNPYLIKGVDHEIKSFSLSKARDDLWEDRAFPEG